MKKTKYEKSRNLKPIYKKPDTERPEGMHLDRVSADGRARVYKNNKGQHNSALLIFEG